MNQTLTPGANAPLQETTARIEFRMETIPGSTIDISAFLLTSSGKVRSDDDMCFYGQNSIEGGAVELQQAQDGNAIFSYALERLPAAIEKVVFTATIHENKTSFGCIPEIRVDAAGILGAISCDGMTETALMLAEFYRRQGTWKLRILGQGFNGGLAALATHLGVEITDDPAPIAPPKVEPKPISLSKVSLTKDRRSVSLAKSSGRFGRISVNLNWNQRPAGQGLIRGMMGSGQIDLDLGALIEDRHGNLSCVQALGNGFGEFNYFPYVRLRGDDRTGAVTDGEWLDINGEQWPEFNRILIYAFIYGGAPNWQATDGVVRLHIPDQPEIEVRMNEQGGRQGMCAIASLENEGGKIKVNRHVQFFQGHSDMDRHFGWGLNWVAGRK
ncbi:TerD family protein [Epibacterium sp. DP7N7-1]|nr:TerD family protein [Epibacterium sp. DP7N7-1]